jgi:hypothetical protein
MRKTTILLSLASWLVMTSCAGEYAIQGSSSVSRLDGKMLFVKVPRDGNMVNVDSAEVVHGIFEMKGTADTACLAALYMDDESIMPLVIEKGHIVINIGNARSTVSGTPLNDKLYDFVAKKNTLDDKADALERSESRMIMDGVPEEEILQTMTTERKKLNDEMNDLLKSFITENYTNPLGPGVFMMWCNNFPYPVMTPVIQEIVDGAPEAFTNDPLVKEYIELAKVNMEKLSSMQ